MTLRHFLAGICTAAMAAWAQQSPETSEGPGKLWILKKLTVGGRDISLPPKPDLSITFFPDGKVAGYTGVNSLSGGYRIAAGRIEWTPIRTTRKGSSKELMDLESTFTRVLLQCTSIAEAGETLTLSGNEGTLTFARITTDPARPR